VNALCTLCACEAVAEAFGFPVCDYHKTHGEDDPACPRCAVTEDWSPRRLGAVLRLVEEIERRVAALEEAARGGACAVRFDGPGPEGPCVLPRGHAGCHRCGSWEWV
jgi:hypothetical protein